MGVTITTTATFLFQESVAPIEIYFPYSLRKKTTTSINRVSLLYYMFIHPTLLSKMFITTVYCIQLPLLYSRRLNACTCCTWYTCILVAYYSRTKWTNTLYSRLHLPSYLSEIWPYLRHESIIIRIINDKDNNTTITSPLKKWTEHR